MTQTKEMSRAQEIANTILCQLGGNKFLACTGSKHLSYSESEPGYLQMKLARNAAGATHLRISLDAWDTYKMVFTRARQNKKEFTFEVKEVKVYEGIYAEQLQELFTKTTGLYTSLGTMGR